ncbi:helix-turn-helix transcriptional regulator [Carboxylicivirga sp. M1479]|uniref:ArsR/SmtB family transcription factor n=1 Tax=Carboxylicivirga sp. M1479 TaxID=2594476 RepID=UPI0011780C59|nr:metalloregulator ArsR/SmtB family transcription factor [Carboxylicivirga sp. M1479]TRX72526.1 helix-turn-helix transcriptional regulator [Carboxylicivirga sp. M1479]
MPQAKTNLFEDDLQELSQLFKALGHPARLQILKFLSKQNTCFSGDINDIVPLGRTTVNQHIAELKKAGLIKSSTQGTKTNYCLNNDGISKLNQLGISFLSEIQCSSCNTNEC